MAARCCGDKTSLQVFPRSQISRDFHNQQEEFWKKRGISSVMFARRVFASPSVHKVDFWKVALYDSLESRHVVLKGRFVLLYENWKPISSIFHGKFSWVRDGCSRLSASSQHLLPSRNDHRVC